MSGIAGVATGTGLWKYIGAVVAALALIALIVGGVRSCQKSKQDQQNQLVNAGQAQQRAADQGEVLNHVQTAQNAVSNPSAAERNVVCSKWDRNCSGTGSK